MAQLFKNFIPDALGNIPTGMVLRRNAVNADYQIAEDVDGKFLRYLSTSASSAKGVSYSAVPSSGITEIYAEIRDLDSSVPASGRLILFASDSPDNEYGVNADINNGTYGRISLYRRSSGTYSDISTSQFTAELRPTPESYYKLLLQIIPGTPNQLRVKFWLSGTVEPAEWRIDTTNAAVVLTTGWSGHVGFAQNDEVRYRAVGIGTDGDPAPREPIVEDITVEILAQEEGDDTASFSIDTDISVSIMAQETGDDVADFSLSTDVNVSIQAQEVGDDIASFSLSSSIDVTIAAQEVGDDFAIFNFESDDTVTVEILAQEEGDDTAQFVFTVGQSYIIPEGCTSIQNVSPIYDIEETSPIYSIEDVTCQLT